MFQVQRVLKSPVTVRLFFTTLLTLDVSFVCCFLKTVCCNRKNFISKHRFFTKADFMKTLQDLLVYFNPEKLVNCSASPEKWTKNTFLLMMPLSTFPPNSPIAVLPKFEVVIKAPKIVHQEDVLRGSVSAK